MRKMILLAAMAAVAALMLAAPPALAQEGPPFRDLDGVFVKPGDCGSFPGEDRVPRGDLGRFGITEEEIAAEFPGEGPRFFCVFVGDEPPEPEPPKPDDKDDDDDRDRDRDRRDNRDDVVVPVLEITQDLDQEADSGDVDQSFDVSQTGDNSNQTAGIQGVANTGNAQTQLGVIDAGNGFGDFDSNNGDNDRFFVRDNDDDDDFCDDDDRFFFDFCDDNNNHNDDDFCDFVDCDGNDNDLCDVFGGDFCDNDNND